MVERMLSGPESDRASDMTERGRIARIRGLDALGSARLLPAKGQRRLASAALCYVSADMTCLAVAAFHSLPPFTVELEDVPASAGFTLFPEPVCRYDADGGDGTRALRVPTIAISWGPTKQVRDRTSGPPGKGDPNE